MWLGRDWIIHSSDTSFPMIHFMSTLISYQKSYLTKGTSFPENLATIRFPGSGCIGPLHQRRSPHPNHYTKDFQWTIDAIERVPNSDSDGTFQTDLASILERRQWIEVLCTTKIVWSYKFFQTKRFYVF